MIVKLDVIPIADRPYSEPSQDDANVILATKEGTSGMRWWTVKVQKFIKGWGPDGIARLEGVTTYKGSRCQIIAWYRLDAVDDVLGTMHIHVPEPEEP